MEQFIEENCTIAFQGKEYSAGGAYMIGDVAALYIATKEGKLIATTWEGALISNKVRVVSEWTRFNKYGEPFRMQQIEVTIENKTYTGRYGCDWSQLCKLKLKKEK